ncbi:Rv2231c family pyridoxal phosphate-dependent protein CobC [Embleya sp. NBC_00896]|uniref:Rv2231c family pyridoxal phosphate-dependent protein CobC n=1 Tax=Embleya sp. NBC_00896 TaxID=2975961 RepID=UPI00386399BB|nr:Rv2231c family pyridoxal phosphate-dependent protein CobC [Embleya sp. NBC_00896]
MTGLDGPIPDERDGTTSAVAEQDVDLRHHGDSELGPGLVDLAVNVRLSAPPPWLTRRLVASLADLAAYPDTRRARAAIAARHRRPIAEVLPTAGAAEAFVLLARTLTPRHAVVVHPQFTEPEAALRAAGHTVHRVVLDEKDGFTLDPARIPDEADLVVLGNPTNPTSVLHRASTIAALARPGRILVVDEAFADTIPGELESVAERRDLPGLVVVRSLTKTWALAGLRIGYVLASPDLVRILTDAQPLWSVSTPALIAAEACCTPEALAQAEALAVTLAADRSYLVERLRAVSGMRLPVAPRSSFVLARIEGGPEIREQLRERGYAVRRADTFPGLGPDWLRIAVRDRATTLAFAAALEGVVT